MKMPPFWSVLLGIFIGVLVGALPSRHLKPAINPAGSSALRKFSMAEVLAKAGDAQCKVLEDHITDAFPPLDPSPRIGRRIVAQAIVAESAQGDFISRFQRGAEAALSAHGAVFKGQVDASWSSSEMIAGHPLSTDLELPRRFYAIGKIHGVADFWCMAEAGRITIIVSLMEGA